MDISWCVCLLFVRLLVPTSSHKCHRNVETVWLSEAGSSPVVSSPLLADINGDNVLDVAVCTFEGQVSVLDGRSGHELPGWPVTVPGHNFHAAPLLYDIDKDGLMEILLSTSDGIIMFLKSDSTPLTQPILKVPPLKVKKNWYVVSLEQIQTNEFHDMEPRFASKLADQSEFINKANSEKNEVPDDIWSMYSATSPPSGLSKDGSHVYVDAHILSSPVIADFNSDGLENELIVPVNFYFDQKRVSSHPKDSALPAKDLENYLGSGLVVFNLDTGHITHSSVLEVTKRSTQYPGYILSSPTVVDNSSVVIGTSTGNIYLVKSSKSEPQVLTTMDSIQGQISVADANDDGHLELLTVDDSGNVACIDLTGKRVWESRVSGSPTSGIRVADVNSDGQLDIIFATHDGYVWVLNGDTGKVLSGWPIKLPSEVRATVLVTKLKPGAGSDLDLVIPLLDGMLAIIRCSDQCAEFIDTGVSAFSSAVAANLSPWTNGLELVVGGADGSVMCLGDISNTSASQRPPDMVSSESLFSWPSETLPCTGTTFYSGKIGVAFTETTKQTTEYRGSVFPVEFEIKDQQGKDLRWNHYITKIFIGNKALAMNKTIDSPGVYQEGIQVPSVLGPVLLTIKVMTPNNQCFQDSFHVSFNTHQLEDIHWYLLAPFLTMSCLLLVLYGNELPSEVLPTFMRKRPK